MLFEVLFAPSYGLRLIEEIINVMNEILIT
jgi:hypothetical protein